MRTSHFKNCIFDLGAVIINIDIERTIRAFQALAPTQSEKIQNSILKTDVFFQFEKGAISESQFRDKIRSEFQIELSDNQIDKAWNALLLDFPKHRIDLLQNIQGRYRTFLLSNTNSLHFTAFEAILKESYQIPSLDNLFEKTYYSQNLGMRKPDKEIFEYVMKKHQLIAEETIFFDDNLENILAAERLGIRGIHIQPHQVDILDFFQLDELGVYSLSI